MVFSSIEFLYFFLLVVPIFYALGALRWGHGMPRILFLLAASCFFYMYWNPVYILLLVFSAVLDYCCGLLFLACTREKWRWILLASITGNLLVLGVFKYSRFLYMTAAALLPAVNIHLPDWPKEADLVLPVGISFYTFQTMSYTIDIYRGKAEVERSFIRFALFVTFFTQLVAGPIEKARDLLFQFRDLRHSRPIDVEGAVQQIIYGLFKKMAVADTLGSMISPIFSAPGDHSGAKVLTACLFFSAQIYCDFSGYTDMAIGMAKLLGVKLSLNFNFPYFATSITQFWRRWHISLSSWLREYLYISLGGNRHGPLRTYANLMTTMLLGGLWHGASWNFVLWGFLHGLYLAVERMVANRRAAAMQPTVRPPWQRWALAAVAGLATFTLATLTWIPFRCVEFRDTLACLRQIVFWAPGTVTAPLIAPGTLALGWLLCGLLLLFDLFYSLERTLWQDHRLAAGVKRILPPVFLVLTIIFAAEETTQFIYFQF